MVANVTKIDSTGVLATFLKYIMANTRDKELGLLHVDTELGESLLLGVLDEHQVISAEKPQWHTSVKRSRKRLQDQDEEQWTKDRALMHTDSHAKLLTVLTTDSHMTPDIGVHPWMTCTAHSSTRRPLRSTIAPSLAYGQRLSQGRWRQCKVIC